MTRLPRPRWAYRLHARLLGYFWLPCPICRRRFSGWEWAHRNYPSITTTSRPVHVRTATCTQACATRHATIQAAYQTDPTP